MATPRGQWGIVAVPLLCLVRPAHALGTITSVGIVAGGAAIVMLAAFFLSRVLRRRSARRAMLRKAGIMKSGSLRASCFF
jgi:hypothetical protein